MLWSTQILYIYYRLFRIKMYCIWNRLSDVVLFIDFIKLIVRTLVFIWFYFFYLCISISKLIYRIDWTLKSKHSYRTPLYTRAQCTHMVFYSCLIVVGGKYANGILNIHENSDNKQHTTTHISYFQIPTASFCRRKCQSLRQKYNYVF